MIKLKLKHLLLATLFALKPLEKPQETFGLSSRLKSELYSGISASLTILTVFVGSSYLYIGFLQQKGKERNAFKKETDKKDYKYEPTLKCFFADSSYNMILGMFIFSLSPLVMFFTSELAVIMAYSRD